MGPSADPPTLEPDLERLRSTAPPVTQIRGPVQEAVDRMLELVGRSGYPALAGPHIGFRGRVVVVDLSRTGRRPIVLINPVVESVTRETQVDAEGCHLLPDLVTDVERPVRVAVRGRARSGQTVRIRAAGLLGRILQHQLDHLDGRLLLDHLHGVRRVAARRRFRQAPGCTLER